MHAQSQPLVIGLLGGIGSGKSTVAKILEDESCVVSNADAIVQDLLGRPDIQQTLQGWWGPGVIGAEGGLDRSEIARIVFADPAERGRLEGLLHPLVELERQSAFAAAPRARAHVIDAPLLLEAGLQDRCDVLIFVDSPRSDRIRRIQARGWTAEDLDQRESAQWSLDRKREHAHHVVVNDGTPAALHRKTTDLLESLVPRTCDGPR
ncbi:MAG: dephospho-CoA kinase [Phycisphaerales bacterium]|nr:dephospho-CoA kinase [Phycisphaerales bacterium]